MLRSLRADVSDDLGHLQKIYILASSSGEIFNSGVNHKRNSVQHLKSITVVRTCSLFRNITFVGLIIHEFAVAVTIVVVGF